MSSKVFMQAVVYSAGIAFGTQALASNASNNDEKVILTQLVEDIGAAERVDAVDRLRTLSQEIPSAACHLYNGVEPDESLRLLKEAKQEFIKIMNALEQGDPSMNIIGVETDRRVLADLAKTAEIWAVMVPSLQQVIDDPQDAAAIAVIKSQNEPLFDATAHLLSVVSGEYSNPAELLQVDAILIDIAGRQSMLTQKIAKEACEIWTGNRSDDRVDALKSSVQTFEVSMNALLSGMPEAGVKAAPTPEIKAGLETLLEDWVIIKAHVDAVLSDEIDDAEKADLYLRLNAKMYKMDEIVHKYTEYSKHK